MKLVIDIDENLYSYITKEDAVYFPDDGGELFEAVKNGTPLDKIRAEIEQVRSIMDEEIINHNRKDLINFVNGLIQSLMIIDKYRAESEEKG